MGGGKPQRVGPAHALSQDMNALTPARRVVLDVLGTTGHPMTVVEVAEATDLHLNTVREHLEILVDHGLAHRGRVAPEGRGRPASTYQYAPEADVHSPRYGLMANAVVEYVAASFGDGSEVQSHAYRMGRQWGRQIVESGLAGGETFEESLAALVDLLEDSGYEPEVTTGRVEGIDEELPEVRLHRCPMLSLARKHPKLVCIMHLGLVEECLARCGQPEGEDLEPVSRLEAFQGASYCRVNLGVPRELAGLAIGVRSSQDEEAASPDEDAPAQPGEDSDAPSAEAPSQPEM